MFTEFYKLQYKLHYIILFLESQISHLGFHVSSLFMFRISNRIKAHTFDRSVLLPNYLLACRRMLLSISHFISILSFRNRNETETEIKSSGFFECGALLSFTFYVLISLWLKKYLDVVYVKRSSADYNESGKIWCCHELNRVIMKMIMPQSLFYLLVLFPHWTFNT